MHESHHPDVHGKSWKALALELVMIGVGVFMGLQVDQWKENRAHRESARATLENFRVELRGNRAAVASEHAYHVRLAQGFQSAVAGGANAPRTLDALFTRAGWHGAGEIGFRHTAWDLALANQSLGYLDQRLAFAVADVYLKQQKFDDYQGTIQRNALNPSSLRPDALGGLAFMLMAFYSDAAGSIEPDLDRQYGAAIAKLDTAIARVRD